MALDFNSFLKSVGVGGNSPVVQPQVQSSPPQQKQSFLSNFMGGLKKVASTIYDVGFKPGMEAQQAVGQGIIDTAKQGVENYSQNLKLISNPETQKQFTENAGPLRQAAVNYTLAPLAQVPYNVKGALDKSKTTPERVVSGVNAAIGAAQLIPGFTGKDDFYFAIYNGLKGIKSAQKEGKRGLDVYKEGANYLTGEKSTGLGTATLSDPTAQKALDIAELPLLFIGGMSLSKKKQAIETIKQMEPDILRTIRGIRNYDKFSPQTQMQIIQETIDVAKKVIPDVIKLDEMKKLSVRSPAEWMKTVSSFIEDRLVSANNPEFNIGLNTRTLKKLPDEVIENTKNLSKTTSGPMTSPLSQTELATNQGVVKNTSSVESIALPEKSIATPVNKIIEALTGAKPIRAEQEALYSAERARRISGVVEAGKTPGEAGYFGQLGALKGELPKVNFESIRSKITQPDIDELFNSIEASDLLPLEKVTAKNGLAKLLGSGGGVVPTEGEIKLLDQIFPPEFTKAVLSQRPIMQKLFEGAESVLNVPRAVMASFDVSAPFRQGVFLVGRPKQWIPAFKDMFKYLVSDEALSNLNSEIKSRPTYNLMRESKLALTDTSTVGLSNREEAFMSNLAEKIPIIGKGVQASQRAYTGFLNKLRADVFDDILKQSNIAGVKQTQKLTDDLAKFINSATGRGDLGSLNKHATLLNTVLFSPRLMASRINLLNPKYYMNLDPYVRKEALKSLFSFGTIGLSIVGLAKMAGADVETAPNSADFGKIKIGNTRYDPWGGFQQYIRLAAQLISGKIKSSTTGATMTLGEGYNAMTRKDILERFIETKEAPVATFITGLLRGTDQSGEKINVGKELVNRFIPLVFQDLTDLSKDEGLIKAGIKLAPGLFGIGVQNYSSTPKDVVRSYRQVEKEVNDLLMEGKTEEAQKMQEKNQETLRIGPQLEPIQSLITDLNNYKKTVQKTSGVDNALKKKTITDTDNQIKELEKQIEDIYKQIKQKPGPIVNPQ